MDSHCDEAFVVGDVVSVAPDLANRKYLHALKVYDIAGSERGFVADINALLIAPAIRAGAGRCAVQFRRVVHL